MAVIKLNLDLRQEGEILLSHQSGGEVLFTQTDQMKASPAVLWMSNMVPTKSGLASTAEIPQLPASALPALTFDASSKYDIQLVHHESGASTYYMYVDSQHLVFSPLVGTWAVLRTESADTDHPSTAFLQGKSYVFHKDLGVANFNATFTAFEVQALSGITASLLEGITAHNNYLIAWTADTIYWSSPTDPLEFTPVVATLTTGAGSAKVQQVKGTIMACLPTTDGIIIYTTKNAVSMKYSGNSSNPWVFREIKNSSGVLDSDHVSAESNTELHFAWTASGFQGLTASGATNSFPDISDFLGGDEFSRLANDTNDLEVVKTSHIEVKVALISSRYLCLSYGETSRPKEFILVYDLSLKRWGRIKTAHLDLFAFADPEMVTDTPYSALTGTYASYANVKYKYWGATSRKSTIVPSTLGILKPDGAIHKIELIRNDTEGKLTAQEFNGELLIGDIKATRNKQCMVSEIKLYGEVENASVTLQTQSTYGNIPSTPTVDPNDPSKFYATNSGDSHKLRINGKFTISNVVLALLQTGYM